MKTNIFLITMLAFCVFIGICYGVDFVKKFDVQKETVMAVQKKMEHASYELFNEQKTVVADIKATLTPELQKKLAVNFKKVEDNITEGEKELKDQINEINENLAAMSSTVNNLQGQKDNFFYGMVGTSIGLLTSLVGLFNEILKNKQLRFEVARLKA